MLTLGSEPHITACWYGSSGNTFLRFFGYGQDRMQKIEGHPIAEIHAELTVAGYQLAWSNEFCSRRYIKRDDAIRQWQTSRKQRPYYPPKEQLRLF